MMDTPHVTVQPTDEKERARRRRQVDSVLGSSRIEGVEIDAEGLAVLERYIDGELSIDQVLPAMRKRL